MSEHTPTPWFVSGVRFRMNGGEWQSINRYDEAKKQDENIACVGYDSRTGVGFADAAFIVKAVNSHDALVRALEGLINAGNAAVGADANDTEAAEAFEMWNIARRDARRALVGHQRSGS